MTDPIGFYTDKNGRVRPVMPSKGKRVRFSRVKTKLDITGCNPANDTVKVKVPTKDGHVEREFSLMRHPSPYAVKEGDKPPDKPPDAGVKPHHSDANLTPVPDVPELPEEVKNIKKRLENPNAITFTYNSIGEDDDAFELLTLSKRVDRTVFNELMREKAIRPVEYIDEEWGTKKTAWEVDEEKATPILKRHGFEVVSSAEKRKLDQTEAEIKKQKQAAVSVAMRNIRSVFTRDTYVKTKGGQMLPFPEGEVLISESNPPNIYGGGEWYVIQPDHIWYIENNGSDGADWSLNNIRTGGAGAIGYRVPRTPLLEKSIRAVSRKP